MARRSRARSIALQVLYQDDLNPRHNPALADELLRRRLREPELVEFGQRLVAGVRLHRQEIDETLERTAANWSVSRMAVTDRNVLRLGAYELLYGDAPARVVIDEAVELAKRFGTANSGSFVNGILDRLMRDGKQADPPTEK